ncbi:protein translocase subunit SecD [Acidaminobacterium chupaoyuni]
MKKSVISFVCMILVIGLLATVLFCGVDFGFFSIPKITNTDDGIRLGLDLVGGSSITFEGMADSKISAEQLNADMDSVESLLRGRLDYLGLYEAQVYRVGDRRVTVEIPSISDPEEAVRKLGSTAQLEFRDADGKVIIKGADVKSASAKYGALDATKVQQNYVLLSLTDEGSALFKEATKTAAGRSSDGKNYISITLDGEEISKPYVDSKYAENGLSGDVVISGGFDAESAGWLANVIAAGQLPFELKQVELRSVGAQLGMTALQTSIKAGVIGLILVIIFMIAMYRLPGVVASVALLFYCVLEGLILTIFRVNLSLPGIAGIILSIGMAVDADVVIFERIKEELRTGKTIKSAIDSGFHRAFSAILDSNITTFIAAVVLYFFGKGTIVGFAITLGLGIILSMFTALTITKFLLNSLVGMKVTNLKLYGAGERRDA